MTTNFEWDSDEAKMFQQPAIYPFRQIEDPDLVNFDISIIGIKNSEGIPNPNSSRVTLWYVIFVFVLC